MIPIAPISLGALRQTHGGTIEGDAAHVVTRIARVHDAAAGDLAPLTNGRYLALAVEAAARGAALLVESSLAPRLPGGARWSTPNATRVLALLLDTARVDDAAAVIDPSATVHPTAILGPRVVVQARVTIGPYAVVGGPGFGWVVGPRGAERPVPQLGGVVLEDDVQVGAHCTIDAGTLAPTRIGRGTKLDAHVHVGHNVTIGPGCIVAAQVGFAGSVTVGAGVLVGGQAGLADHVVVGDGARIAAKAGVIGDVPAGTVVAGYPAIARARWLRGLAEVFKKRTPRSRS